MKDLEKISLDVLGYKLADQYRDMMLVRSSAAQRLIDESEKVTKQLAFLGTYSDPALDLMLEGIRLRDSLVDIDRDFGDTISSAIARATAVPNYPNDLLLIANRAAEQFRTLATGFLSGVGPLNLEIESLGGLADFQLPSSRIANLIGNAAFSIDAYGELEGGTEAYDGDFEENRILIPEDIRRGLVEYCRVPLALVKKIRESPEQIDRWIEDWREFEHLMAQLFDDNGAEDVFVTPRSGDGGIDVFATYRRDGSRVLLACQCKKYRKDRTINVETAHSFIGALTMSTANPNVGVLATMSGFQSGALNLLTQRIGLESRHVDLEAYGPDEIAKLIRQS